MHAPDAAPDGPTLPGAAQLPHPASGPSSTRPARSSRSSPTPVGSGASWSAPPRPAAGEAYRAARGRHRDRHQGHGNTGTSRSRVGVVGASRIGCRVIALLTPYDLELAVYEPCMSAEQAPGLGARAVGLDELRRTCDVVSRHTPPPCRRPRVVSDRYGAGPPFAHEARREDLHRSA
ncbi:NAD(P)-dependent oxidoreductase [Streptomyces sp. NPDC060232]|uniref:NAD(P)-dependent oxidoreductase n=1 Tax=Streptomyces sp. NPDC060232 TaxID=3347079 RepID=UPI003665F0D1